MSADTHPSAVEANRHAWNAHARRYLEENPLPLDEVDYCGQYFPTEADLGLLGSCSGLRVLELGAGACNCGIALARQGAHVTCADISEEQLAIGRRVAAQHHATIATCRTDMADLSMLAPETFDLVLSVCALQYAPDPRKVFAQAHRVLRKDGRLVFSVDHPIMAAVGAAELWPAEAADPSYGYEGPVVWKWYPDDDMHFTTFRYPVGRYINDLAGAGFAIHRMLELFPKRTDPGWSAKEARLRSRFPSILVISAVKWVTPQPPGRATRRRKRT